MSIKVVKKCLVRKCPGQNMSGREMSGQKLESQEKGVEKSRSTNVWSRNVHESVTDTLVLMEALGKPGHVDTIEFWNFGRFKENSGKTVGC